MVEYPFVFEYKKEIFMFTMVISMVKLELASYFKKKNYEKLVIFGISEYSEVASYYFNNHSDYKIVSYTADDEYVTSNKFNNLDVLPYGNF